MPREPVLSKGKWKRGSGEKGGEKETGGVEKIEVAARI